MPSKPLLYQVAAGILSEGLIALIAAAVRSVVKKQRNARALLAEVNAVDLDGRVVSAGPAGGRRRCCRTTGGWWPVARPTPILAGTSGRSSRPE